MLYSHAYCRPQFMQNVGGWDLRMLLAKEEEAFNRDQVQLLIYPVLLLHTAQVS